MALTYGFYNSENNDRLYDAEQVSSLFDGLIKDGIYSGLGDAFAITPNTSGLIVTVGSGRAWFNHTWLYNDYAIQKTLDNASTTYDRIDAIAIKIDKSNRRNDIVVITGTPSAAPVRPLMPVSNNVYFYPLAYITVKANATAISPIDISDQRGMSTTPWVVGVVTSVSVDNIIDQWQQQFDSFIGAKETEFDTWSAAKQEEYNEFVSTQEAAYEEWISEQEANFDEWFESIRDILDENVAAHLQNEITNNAEVEFKHWIGLCNNSYTYTVDSNNQITQIVATDKDNHIVCTTDFSELNGVETIVTLIELYDDDMEEVIKTYRKTLTNNKVNHTASEVYEEVQNE